MHHCRRLILSVDGLEKRGKTHFALTAPAPIMVLSLDLGMEGVIQKFQSEKEIWVAEHRVNVAALKKSGTTDEIAEQADQAWRNVLTDYQTALDSGARSVIVDSATELWEILRLARFGKLEQVKPHHYGPVNSEYREVIRMAYEYGANLLLLHKMKPEYINDKTTGEYKRSGFSDTGFLVQTILQCWRDDGSKAPDSFHVMVTDCRQDPALNGWDMMGEWATFSNLAMMIFPDSTEEEWK